MATPKHWTLVHPCLHHPSSSDLSSVLWRRPLGAPPAGGCGCTTSVSTGCEVVFWPSTGKRRSTSDKLTNESSHPQRSVSHHLGIATGRHCCPPSSVRVNVHSPAVAECHSTELSMPGTKSAKSACLRRRDGPSPPPLSTGLSICPRREQNYLCRAQNLRNQRVFVAGTVPRPS